MRVSTRSIIAGIAVAASAFVVSSVAEAKCTRLAFSVNDYGKEGPIRDAKQLLDVYVAKWTAERGIKKYTTGKKDVSCELFLDLLVFDEYTCKAEATVCWPDGAGGAAVAPTAGGSEASPAAKPAKAAKPKSAEVKQ